MRTFGALREIETAVGEELGVSDWFLIDQERINHFAEATEDRQWIHVDEAAAAVGPYGATIAHGYLTLSLLPALASEVVEFPSRVARINYGLGTVRFPAPILVDHRIRDRVTLVESEPHPSGLKILLRHVVEIEGLAKPACVAGAYTLLSPVGNPS